VIGNHADGQSPENWVIGNNETIPSAQSIGITLSNSNAARILAPRSIRAF